MNSLKARLLAIAVMVVASAWALFPRTVEDRFQRDGVMVDTTYTRIPLKYGLDLRGGMHLALEIDRHPLEIGDHGLDLGDPAALLVDLKLLQANEGIS